MEINYDALLADFKLMLEFFVFITNSLNLKIVFTRVIKNFAIMERKCSISTIGISHRPKN
jgi:hypothetical protein